MAKIFRLEQNVPDIYVKESRDFQMMCNLFDIMNSGTKFDIDTMPNVLDPTLCNESVLPFLQTKLGFFTKRNFTSKEIRHILSSFKRIVKDKGSRIGIREAIEVYLKLICSLGSYKITVTNSEELNNTTNSANYNKFNNVYLIEIQLETTIKNLSVLREMLKYVLPTGYDVRFGFYSAEEFNSNIHLSSDVFNIVIISENANNKIYNEEQDTEHGYNYSGTENDYRGQVSTTHTVEKEGST